MKNNEKTKKKKYFPHARSLTIITKAENKNETKKNRRRKVKKNKKEQKNKKRKNFRYINVCVQIFLSEYL